MCALGQKRKWEDATGKEKNETRSRVEEVKVEVGVVFASKERKTVRKDFGISVLDARSLPCKQSKKENTYTTHISSTVIARTFRNRRSSKEHAGSCGQW
jgi:hypothetical protein